MASAVYSKTDVDIGLNLRAYRFRTYLEYGVDVCLSMLQAGVDRRVLSNTVDMKGNVKTNGVSTDILNTQKVDGSTLYDALELTFNTVDKTSVLKASSIDTSQPINNKAASNDVYNNHEVDLIFASLIGAAPDVLNTSIELASPLVHDQKYATTIQNHIRNNSDKVNT